MREWWSEYYQYLVDRLGPSAISAESGSGLSTVNKRLSNVEFQEYCETQRIEAEHRSAMSAGERMGAVLDTLMSSLERKLARAGLDDDKVLELVGKVVELGRLVPPTKSKKGPLDVFEVGATDEGFPVIDVEDTRDEVEEPPIGVEFGDGKFANEGEEVEWVPTAGGSDEFEELE